MLAATMAGLPPGPARAQTEVAFEVGASHVGPAVGAEGESSRFGIAGMRLSHYTLGGSGINASLMLGRTFGDSVAGDFVSAVVVGALREDWGTRWIAGWDVELAGFEVRAPFPYRAVAVEGGPRLSLRAGPLTATATGLFGIGASRIELWRRFDGIHRVFEDDLWRVGGTAELLFGNGPLRVGVVGGAHDSPSGTYRSGGARLLMSGGWGAIEAQAEFWRAPLGTETELTGGLTFVIPVSGWRLRGFLGRSEPDPLTLTDPGGGSGGLLLARSLYSTDTELEDMPTPYSVQEETVAGARVRIRVDAPADAASVSLIGDFTLWDPIPMRQEGGSWAVDVDIPYGTYHYGFLVDDEWYLPDDALDVVPDEWGRQSAILVIEGAN